MKILVFGKSGQVAHELSAFEGTKCIGREEADLTRPDECAEIIHKGGFDAVINAAAYTAVDKAEEEEQLASIINGTAPGVMAKACSEYGIPFVHISTDYVFDGEGSTPWNLDDAPDPQNAYGRSKLLGEIAVRQVGGAYAVMRTSWVFSAHGSNFVKTMLLLGENRDVLSIVNDQFGGPTPARDIAHAAFEMARQLFNDSGKAGIYHYAGAPNTTWADFARFIFKQAGLNCEVLGIPSEAYPTPAKRPLNSRLDCATTFDVFGISPPDWRLGLTKVLEDLK